MDKIAVVDFGGQYTHLIANRIRRLEVFSEVVSPSVSPSRLRGYCGIILSGSPYSVTDAGGPRIDPGVFQLGIPVLGLCYGHQLMALLLHGDVVRGDMREYGTAELKRCGPSPLFEGLDQNEKVWMSHGDTVRTLPAGFGIIGSTADCAAAAVADEQRRLYGLQFHPEVSDTPHGMKVLDNFLSICGCDRAWNARRFLQDLRKDISDRCSGKKVFLLVSGGVDSTVAFALLNEALGQDRVIGLHIDNGCMRHEESDAVIGYFREHGFDNVVVEDAARRFLEKLGGVADPERKREVIGTTFIEVMQDAQKKLNLSTDDWLVAQGTIYPDTIESAGTEHADKIKTHHNRVDVVMELIEKGEVIEPLSQLYKDEVRILGEELGLPHHLVWRHPFPGPGLGVRVLCSDGAEPRLEESIQQRLADLCRDTAYRGRVLALRSVGVQGDSRTYAHPALLSGELDWDTLELLSTRITNAMPEVNRVLFGLSSPEITGYHVHCAYVTKDRLDKLREVDNSVTRALHDHGEYESIWQMPVVLLPLVNQAGGECVVLRPVLSREAMTARFAALKPATIETIVNAARLVEGIGDLFYDITHKPPGTIEWE